MQHVYEYIIDHEVSSDKESMEFREHDFYVTQSSRFSKVAKRILADKKITINNVKNFQLRKIR